MNKFECPYCKHIVHSEGEKVSPITWSDGHTCFFIKETDEERLEVIKDLIIDNRKDTL